MTISQTCVILVWRMHVGLTVVLSEQATKNKTSYNKAICIFICLERGKYVNIGVILLNFSNMGLILPGLISPGRAAEPWTEHDVHDIYSIYSLIGTLSLVTQLFYNLLLFLLPPSCDMLGQYFILWDEMIHVMAGYWATLLQMCWSFVVTFYAEFSNVFLQRAFPATDFPALYCYII